MSDKQKKFQPNAGYMLAVHQNIIFIRSLALALDIFPDRLGELLEITGLQLQADPFDLSADATKVIKLQEERKTQGLHLVKEGHEQSSSDTATDRE